MRINDYRKIFQLIKNFINLFIGQKVIISSLGSMTLDKDDVNIARKFLRGEGNWEDDQVIKDFEFEFQRKNQSNYAYSFMGGRVALSACIYALGLKKGDKVLVPAFTCIVVPNAFRYEGIEIVFYDIELDTFGPNLEDLEQKFNNNNNNNIKAVLIHHLFGLVARDYEKIIKFCKANDLFTIEDCAHSFGTEYKKIPVGNLGNVAFYSSEQSKIINTTNGGIATTNDPFFAKKIAEFQNDSHFPSKKRTEKLLKSLIFNYYSHKYRFRWLNGYWKTFLLRKDRIISTTKEEEKGVKPSYYKQRMPAPIASIGLNQLIKLDYYKRVRKEGAEKWQDWCKTNNYNAPLIVENSDPNFLRFPILVEKERKTHAYMLSKELNIQVGVWFTSHLHPVNEAIKGCPNAKIAVQQLINFPTILNENV